MRTICLTIICAATLVVPALSDAQSPARPLEITLIDGAGTARGGMPPLATPPKPDSQLRPVVVMFLPRENAKTSSGQVVSGIGINAWLEAGHAVVVVVALVPKVDAPNSYQPDRMTNLTELLIDKVAIEPGKEVLITKAKALGIAAPSIRFAARSSNSTFVSH